MIQPETERSIPLNGFTGWKNLFSGRMLQRGYLAIFDQLVFGATNFLTTIIIARAAGNGELGFYALGLSLVMIGLDLQNSLILIPYTVYSPRMTEDDRARYAGSTLLHSVFLSILSVVVLGAAGLCFPSASGGHGPGTFISWGLLAAVPFLYFRQYARLISFARLRIGSALSIDTVVAILQIGGLVALVRMHLLRSAGAAYWMTACACAVGSCFWLFTRRMRFECGLPSALRDLKRNWRFSRWLVATTPVGILRTQLGLWLLAASHGTGATGFYAACVNVTSLANPFLTGVNNLVGAKAAHQYAEAGHPALRRLIWGATALIGVGMALFCVVVFFFGGRLISLMYGSGYSWLSMPLAVLAMASLITSLSSPAYRGLLVLEKSKVTLSTEVYMLIIQGTLGIWLVLRFGIMGAAFSALIGNVVGAAYQVMMFCGHRADPDISGDPHRRSIKQGELQNNDVA